MADERLKALSFTGSAAVGWRLKGLAGRKKVILELGGNAACIVDRDADLELAAARLAIGAFSHAGQVCIAVKRLLVHQDIYQAFREIFLRTVQGKGGGRGPAPGGNPGGALYRRRGRGQGQGSGSRKP